MTRINVKGSLGPNTTAAMSVVNLPQPPNGPEGSHAIHSGGDRPYEVLFTRVVLAPRGVVGGVVESSLSTYLKLMHKIGILRFAEDQVIVTGWRKWFRGVSSFLRIFISEG